MGNCDHRSHELRRHMACNGHWQVGNFCLDCATFIKFPDQPGMWFSHKGLILDDIPIETWGVMEECGHCKTMQFCEWHHYGPKEMFGNDDAESWPQGWLCVSCHDYWHARMKRPIRGSNG